MIENVARIQADRNASSLADLNSLLNSHAGRPRAQAFKPIPTKGASLPGKGILQHDLASRNIRSAFTCRGPPAG